MNASSMVVIGKNLRALRKARGLSIFNVANDLQMSAHYLGDIEQGEANPSIKALDKLAAYYGVSVRTLFGQKLRVVRRVRQRPIAAVVQTIQ